MANTFQITCYGKTKRYSESKRPDGASYNEEGEGTIFCQGSTDFGIRFPSLSCRYRANIYDNDIF